MSKRDIQGNSRLVSFTPPPQHSWPLSAMPAIRPIRSNTLTPAPDGDSASSASRTPSNDVEVDGKGFWNKNGMDVLVDWITEPENHKRYFVKRKAGVTLGHLQEEIAQLINQRNLDSGKETATKWTKSTVKSRMEYLKKKYNLASAELKKTGAGDNDDGTLMDLVRDICPCYDKLSTVFRGTLLQDPPPPRATLTLASLSTPSDQTSLATPAISSTSVTERTPPYNSSEFISDDDFSVSNSTGQGSNPAKAEKYEGPFKKRQKVVNMPEALHESFNRLEQTAEQVMLIDIKEREDIRQDSYHRQEMLAQREDTLRQRDEALNLREQAWLRKEEIWLKKEATMEEKLSVIEAKHEEQLKKRAVESNLVLIRQNEEFQQQKEEFKEERYEFKQEKSEFRQERAEFRIEVTNFMSLRDKLLQENAAMSREIQMRHRIPSPK
ncbi:hypothetical protein BGZ59_007883 [Podila verticillata]|nr:hypothetical protein BGZ59_007883 [Podila verticillata]